MKTITAAALTLSTAAANAAHAQRIEAVTAVFPAPEADTDQDLHGEVWQSPDLSARDRSIVNVTSIISRNQAEEIPAEFTRALENRVTPAELSEIITRLSFYSGWGNAALAAEVTQEIFGERWVDPAQLPAADPEQSRAARDRRSSGRSCLGARITSPRAAAVSALVRRR